jgi:hypothetical protein
MPDAQPDLERAGSFPLGSWQVNRIGYGANAASRRRSIRPPCDRDEALRVLRAATDGGINHIDTARYYGQRVVNELIHQALYPNPAALAPGKQGRGAPGWSLWPDAVDDRADSIALAALCRGLALRRHV